MPVYICQAGSNSSEPWRDGLQVYAAPFQLTDLPSGDPRDDLGATCTIAPREGVFGTTNEDSKIDNNSTTGRNRQPVNSLNFGSCVRRIRHAEVVLVDDVCIAYDRHWLRLRWPGQKGGFAGYVALGKVNETSISKQALGMLQPRGMPMLFYLFLFLRLYWTIEF